MYEVRLRVGLDTLHVMADDGQNFIVQVPETDTGWYPMFNLPSTASSPVEVMVMARRLKPRRPEPPPVEQPTKKRWWRW